MSQESFHDRAQYRSLSGESQPWNSSHKSTPVLLDDPGSGWVGAAFNLTSSIVGAGCIGLGGAIAHSGGLVSLVAMIVFAVLSKFSFDLVVELSLIEPSRGADAAPFATNDDDDERATNSTYESLGFAAYGNAGRMTVILSKGLYSFGSLVAYIVIVKDNFAFALAHLLYGYDAERREPDEMTTGGTLEKILTNQYLVTTFFCTSVMLPLSMLRNVAPLERFSAFKITVVILIVMIVMYLFVVSDERQVSSMNFSNHWLEIHGGVFESLGTFVFTYVAQHSIHLVFQSLKKSQRKHFSKTTTLGTAISTMISILLGFFAYMTFWENTSSDVFYLYPPSKAIDMCRILLCISMLLTYPFPFLAARELLVLVYAGSHKSRQRNGDRQPVVDESEPLIVRSFVLEEESSWLVPGSSRQLKRKYHILLTCVLWFITLILALGASSLGSVLNLTGCATGTVISYVLPALFSMKLQGHTVLGTSLFLLGGSVGIVGTYYSVITLFQ